MYVNSAVTSKTLKVIRLFVFCGFILLLASLIIEFIHTKDYYQVNGVITKTTKEVNSGIENHSKSDIVRYMHISYKVNDAVYEYKHRTFFIIGKNVGDFKRVFYSPNSPEKVRDGFLIECTIIGMILLGIFFTAMSAMIAHRKRHDEDNRKRVPKIHSN